MSFLLGLALASFIITALAAIPFINLLYRLKFQRQKEVHVLSPVFTKLHAWKVGTPNSGGVLIILVILILGWLALTPEPDPRRSPATLVFLALGLYGLLGLYDDIKKYFGFQKDAFWGMRLRYKLGLQVLFGLFLGWLLFDQLQFAGTVNLTVPFIGSFLVDAAFYIPFAALTIIAAVNAFNITDGVDGLSSGLLIMTLAVLLTIGISSQASSLYLPESRLIELNQVVAIWLGSMLAFLYFNIYPARMWMGDSGALAFGAAMAVVTLLLGIPLLLPVIGGIYVIETVSSLLQWYSMRFMKKKIFLIAPIHHHFEAKGWPETKVTMRFWLAGAVFSLAGLYLYFYLLGL